jgi:hypothetical protein
LVSESTSLVSTTQAIHELTGVDSSDACIAGVVDTGEVMPNQCCSYRLVIPKMLPNFISVVDTSNVSFTGASDISNAYITGVGDTSDAPPEQLAVRQ